MKYTILVIIVVIFVIGCVQARKSTSSSSSSSSSEEDDKKNKQKSPRYDYTQECKSAAHKNTGKDKDECKTFKSCCKDKCDSKFKNKSYHSEARCTSDDNNIDLKKKLECACGASTITSMGMVFSLVTAYIIQYLN